MDTKISAMDLHRKAGDLLARIHYRDERFIIQRRGKPVAVLLGIEEYRQMEALAAEQQPTQQAQPSADHEDALGHAHPTEAERYEPS